MSSRSFVLLAFAAALAAGCAHNTAQTITTSRATLVTARAERRFSAQTAPCVIPLRSGRRCRTVTRDESSARTTIRRRLDRIARSADAEALPRAAHEKDVETWPPSAVAVALSLRTIIRRRGNRAR